MALARARRELYPDLALYPPARSDTIRAWRNDCYEALEAAGQHDTAERWLTCSQNPKTRIKPVEGAAIPRNAEKIYVCSGNHRHEAEIYAQSCDLRICPECAQRHAARLVHRYLPKMQELIHSHHRRFRFRSIMFSTPYALTDENIRQKYLEGFRRVYRVMDSLMHPAKWKGCPWKVPGWKDEQGFIVTAEFGEEGRKLHYHVIHWGEYLNQADLSSAWRTANSDEAYVVWVKGFPYKGWTIEETLRETLKYAVKFYHRDDVTGSVKAIPPEQIPVLAHVLDGTRRVRAYGVFFGIPAPDRPPHSCETCGSPMVGIPVDYFVTYCNTGFLPLEWAQNLAMPLNLKPADKSFQRFSGLPPPEAGKPVVQAKPFDFLRYVRRSDVE